MILHDNARPLNQEAEDSSRRERYGFRKSLEVLSDTIPLATYASTVTELKTARLRLVGSCPIPDHEDATPSFTVYAENSRWYCFGCSRGGDLLDLFMLCEDWPEDDYGPALAAMAQRYNVELPSTRTDTWHRWQSEKERIRATTKKHLARCYQRRLTKVYAPLVLLGGETPEESLQELEELATSLWPVALDMAARRVSGEE